MAWTQNGLQFDDRGRWIPSTGNQAQTYMGRPVINAAPATAPVQLPADWQQFQQNFGAGNPNMNEYTDWQRNQQRERTMADFVARMATPAQTSFQNQVNDFGGDVRAQIDAPQPTMGANRFAGGLSDAEARLNDLITNPSGLQLSPSYQFRVQQGQQALERSLGAKGLLNSGNRLKALTDYGQGAGSQEYEAEYGRRKGLYDTNAGAYNTNQQANTNAFSAQAGAGDARLKTLGGLLQGAGTNLNAANNDRSAWGQIWTNQAPKPTPLAPTRRDYPEAPYPAYRTGWS